MSGQPVNTQSQINKYRNEYMETLALQEQINDMNLQANKTYLLTGQLPPQSQIQDTRTNAEKLKDIDMLKKDIADKLRPIAEPGFAYQIVNKIIDSPLNIDNSLFRFLAQRTPSITEQLSNIYPYGIMGDENDLETIVSFIKNMYSEQQGKFQTTKSYMNSLNSSNVSNSKVISANDIDNIIIGFDDIIKNLEIITDKGISLNPIDMNNIMNISLRIYNIIMNLKDTLPTTNQINLLLQDLQGNYNYVDYPEMGPSRMTGLDTEDIEAFFKLIEKLPKYSEVISLISKIKRYLDSGNINALYDGLSRLEKMFSSVNGIQDIQILNRFKNIKIRQSEKEKKIQKLNELQTRQFIRQQNEEQKDASKAQKVYIVNPQDDAVWVRGLNNDNSSNNSSNISSYQPSLFSDSGYHGSNEYSSNPTSNDYSYFGSSDGFIPLESEDDSYNTNESFDNLVEMLSEEDLAYFFREFNIEGDTKEEKKERLKQILINNSKSGEGIKKKRRGRPKGSGLVNIPKPPKISNFVGFGINEINQKQLDKGIVKIRRTTKSNFMDMPSRRVSKNLQNILKTIVGGGIPKYEELGKLDEDEKNYLHKLISKSSLEDRLSVPTPSKDQEEKDIHNFEIMKGQILSGNDSQELVKKFKLLTRKLSKMGLLPKSDVEDIIDTLTDLGY